MKITQPWDKEPDFVNKDGIKWWIDKSLTQYAHRQDLKGISLPNVVAYFVKKPDKYKGYLTRVLIDNDKQVPIYESQKLEDCAAYIDMLKLDKQHN